MMAPAQAETKALRHR